MASGGEVSSSSRVSGQKRPLVVILGSTGTGKTKLSIELATRFDGEIISADSMQVYRGLDIVTAKATREEQAQARHHLLDVATPDQAFTVIHFREAALPIVDSLLQQNRMPIVVGGTNYYIESLLWQVLVGSGVRHENVRERSPPEQEESLVGKKRPKLASAGNESEDDAADDDDPAKKESESSAAKKVRAEEGKSECVVVAGETAKNEVKPEMVISVGAEVGAGEEDEVHKVLLMTTTQMEQRLESAVLHRVLRRVDPASADRLHPNNKRKIIRALEVFQQDGQPLSSILAEQRAQSGGSNLGGPLRYRNVVILWLRCEQETLNARLDARVDSMVAQGLLPEIRLFYEQHVKPYENTDFHRGILQSIGFKEFAGYLERFDATHDRLVEQAMKSDSSSEEQPEGLPVLRHCLDNLKLVTQRYSRRQLKWINQRFLANARREVPPIYALDTSDVSRWSESVYDPAVRLIEAVLAGQPAPADLQPLPKRVSPHEGLNEETSFQCDVCGGRTIVGEYQWQLHLRSNKHKKCLQGWHRKMKLAQS